MDYLDHDPVLKMDFACDRTFVSTSEMKGRELNKVDILESWGKEAFINLGYRSGTDIGCVRLATCWVDPTLPTILPPDMLRFHLAYFCSLNNSM